MDETRSVYWYLCEIENGDCKIQKDPMSIANVVTEFVTIIKILLIFWMFSIVALRSGQFFNCCYIKHILVYNFFDEIVVLLFFCDKARLGKKYKHGGRRTFTE